MQSLCLLQKILHEYPRWYYYKNVALLHICHICVNFFIFFNFDIHYTHLHPQIRDAKESEINEMKNDPEFMQLLEDCGERRLLNVRH